MAISKEEVIHVANLSRLTLTENEVGTYTEQLNSILDFMKKLNELDTTDIKPTSHAITINNAYRDDEVRESIPKDTALKNAPQKQNEQFKVPPAIE